MSLVICSDACNYGEIAVTDRAIDFNSMEGSSILNLKLEQISQCVVPASNRDEVEIHFHEDDKGHHKDDVLAQITFHFPVDEDNEEDETKAEEFKKKVVDTGVIRSVTGDVIVEFTKEQANFVTPRYYLITFLKYLYFYLFNSYNHF